MPSNAHNYVNITQKWTKLSPKEVNNSRAFQQYVDQSSLKKIEFKMLKIDCAPWLGVWVNKCCETHKS
jgi:hypothetical protein